MIPALITTGAWESITAAVRKQAGKCMAAVAYFGNNAAKQLPLKKGSVLVVDMSHRAVTSGQTKPAEIAKLIRKRVEVHSVENLHAKVFVIGNTVFIGSANVSQHSANVLIEAVAHVKDAELTDQCRQFVWSLCGQQVTLKEARDMQRLYTPPVVPGRGRITVPIHAPDWAVPLEREPWDDEDNAQDAKGQPVAESRLESAGTHKIDTFCYSGAKFLNAVREKHDRVIQVMNEGNRKIVVHPAGRVLYIRKYPVGRSTRAIVYLEVPKHRRGRNLKQLTKRMDSDGKLLGKLNGPRLLRNRKLVHELLNVWG